MDLYIKKLCTLFELNADATKASPMKKYLKNKFEFYGIQTELKRSLLNSFIKENGLPSVGEVENTVKALYSLPQRELHHAAIEIVKKAIKKYETEFIELYKYLIITNSWWDTVDFIATQLAGNYFRKFPEDINWRTENWINSGNIWLQRTAILFQLKYKEKTDTQLLEKYINQLRDSKEFFIRKAIGWALREYSKTDSSFVKEFVVRTDISNFSRNEALKWLKNKGLL